MYVVQTKINSEWIDLTYHRTENDALVDAQRAIADGNSCVRVVKRVDRVIKDWND